MLETLDSRATLAAHLVREAKVFKTGNLALRAMTLQVCLTPLVLSPPPVCFKR